MKKFWAIPLAIILSLSMTSFTYADESNDVSEFKTTYVSTEAEFISAASDTSALVLFNNDVKELSLTKNAQLLATLNILKNQKLVIEKGVTLTLSGKSMIILAGGTLEVSPGAKIVATSNNTTMNVSVGGLLDNSGSIEGNTTMTVYKGAKVKNASTGNIEWSVMVYGDDKSSVENNGTIGADTSFAKDVKVSLDLYGATEKEKLEFIHQLFTVKSQWNLDEGEPYVLEQLHSKSEFFYPDVPTLEGYTFAGWMIATPKGDTKVCLEEFSLNGDELPEDGIYGYYVKENDSTSITGTCVTKHVIDKDTLISKYSDIARYYGYDAEDIAEVVNKEATVNNDSSIVLSKKNAIIIGCIAGVIIVALICSLFVTVKYVKGRNNVKSVNIYKKNK
ncbi:hypothetical protein J6Z48_02780 [bacterium]|nr:hypothetical protein [bacterium]